MFKKILSSLILSLSFFMFSFSFVFAGNPMDQLVNSNGQMDGTNNIQTVSTNAGLSDKEVPDIISRVIKIALGLFGTVALAFVIWGGVDWLFSKGDPKKIGAARDRMIAAAIGLAIIAASYAITDFIISQVAFIAG